MPAPPVIADLVERFRQQGDAYKSGQYNEAQLRKEFVDPMFKALGWDMENVSGYAEAYKDVIHEDAIKIGGATKAPDYCFRIGGTRKFFLEAKKPSVDIKTDAHPAYQLRRYAWSAKLPLSILTDFEEFAVYDCRVEPKLSDKASVARVLYLTFPEYVSQWEEIAKIFAREAILKGSFDKFAESTKAKRGTAEVDDAFLSEIEKWRADLARNLALRNPRLSQRDLNFAVQRTIDRIVFLRICEDRRIEVYGRLQALLNGEHTYRRLYQLFREADDRYNSGLFYFQKEKDRVEPPDDLTPELEIDDGVLKGIIRRLYYPDSPYEFSVLPADILGQVYEQFLGKVIRLTEGHQAKVEDKPEVKKAGGVYYTPTYIVDYIVKNTVGKLLENKTPKQAAKLRILDPACGSGSFLIGAYQYLLDWHRDWYSDNDPKKWATEKNPAIYQGPGGEWKLTTAERKRILLQNIYGVDIDAQAVEVTKLSLLLKVLEGESEQTLATQLRFYHERALPDLGRNIKCGNSLIGTDFYQQTELRFPDEEERYRINAFDWDGKDGFPEIMKTGGFEAVIGNPPWGATISSIEKKYLSSYRSFQGNHDSYLFFIERAKTLLRKFGLLSFVTPDSWIKVPQAKRLRELVLDNFGLQSFTILPQKVFKGVSANCIIFVLGKEAKSGSVSVNLLQRKSELSRLEIGEFDERYELDPAGWKSSADKQFQIYQRNEIATLIRHARSNSIDASTHLDVMQGIVPYSVEEHSRDMITRRAFHSPHKLSDESGPWIQGRSVGRYQLRVKAGEYLRYGPWLHRPRKPKYFEGPRILVQEITGGHPPRIAACFYDKIIYHDPGIISCLANGRDETLFLLGILNSRFLSWYHQHASPKGTRAFFPKVLIGDIRSFPIPKLANSGDRDRHDRMVSLVGRMLDLHKQLAAVKTADDKTRIQRQIDATDAQIDKLVYELYELTPDEIKIVESAT